MYFAVVGGGGCRVVRRVVVGVVVGYDDCSVIIGSSVGGCGSGIIGIGIVRVVSIVVDNVVVHVDDSIVVDDVDVVVDRCGVVIWVVNRGVVVAVVVFVSAYVVVVRVLIVCVVMHGGVTAGCVCVSLSLL